MSKVVAYRDVDTDGAESYSVYVDGQFVGTMLLDELRSTYTNNEIPVDIREGLDEHRSFSAVFERFIAAGPRKMTSADFDAFAGVEGTGYIAEDDEMLYVLDVKDGELTLETYDEFPKDSFTFVRKGQ
jgi:hypothetical protein